MPPPGLRRAGAHGRPLRADLRPALAHQPAHRHEVVAGRRTEDFRIDVEEAAAAPRRGSSPRSPSCARPTTRPAGPSRRARSSRVLRAAPGLVVVDEAYGQFSSWSALGLRAGTDTTPRPRRDPHLLQDLGHGRGAPRVPDRRPRGGAGLRGGGPAVPPLGPDAAGRPAGARLHRRDGGPGGAHRRGAGQGGGRAGGAAGRTLAVRCQLHPLPAAAPRSRPGVARAAGRARSSSATAPAGTGSRAACGSPSGGPTRTTAS